MGPVLLFAIPICIGSILQQLYTTVDTMILGRYCSAVSLAAVGTSAQPVEICLCIFMGIGSGISILVAQNKGKGDFEELKKVMSTAISFVYLAAIPLAIAGQFLAPVILRVMNTPDDTFALATIYVRILFAVTIGNLGYNINAGILRGMGDSTASLIFLLISCVVNTGLDILFIGVFGMDVLGAALATGIAMMISWFSSVLYIRLRFPELKFTFLPRKMDWKMMGKIIKIGLPLGLNSSLYSVGHLVLQALVNLQGSIFIAGCSVGGKVNGLANMVIVSLSSAATSFAGQNYGAGKFDRLKKGSWMIPLCNAAITATAGMLMTFVFCEPVLLWFTKDPAVIEAASRYVHVVLPFSWCYSVLCTIINFANGAGEIKLPTIVNLIMLWGVRIPCAAIIAFFIDGNYVMAGVPISFVFGMVSMIAFLFSKTWQRRVSGEITPS